MADRSRRVVGKRAALYQSGAQVYPLSDFAHIECIGGNALDLEDKRGGCKCF